VKHIQEPECDSKYPEFRNLQQTEKEEVDSPRRIKRMNESNDDSEMGGGGKLMLRNSHLNHKQCGEL
jgi:hypothetical protein